MTPEAKSTFRWFVAVEPVPAVWPVMIVSPPRGVVPVPPEQWRDPRIVGVSVAAIDAGHGGYVETYD